MYVCFLFHRGAGNREEMEKFLEELAVKNLH